ncbi:MAG: aldo/keto reductase, partial [Planctomycetia bacterium]
MLYRPLGAAGVNVSVLGFGGAPLGGVYQAVDEAECRRAVRHALDVGINFIDTAPYYGKTRSESVLGAALLGVPRDRFVVSTKVGRYDVDSFDFSAKRVVASVDESLARLRLEYVDVLIVHDVEFGSLDQIAEETLPALRQVVDQGKARQLGVSGLPLKVFETLLERTTLDVVLSYCHYTL